MVNALIIFKRASGKNIFVKKNSHFISKKIKKKAQELTKIQRQIEEKNYIRSTMDAISML